MVYLEKFTLNQIINITSKMIFPIENKNLNGFYVIAVAALLFANVFLNQIYLYKTMFNKLEPECLMKHYSTITATNSVVFVLKKIMPKIVYPLKFARFEKCI